MKWLIYLLLIFNIGFAAWHFRGLDMREDGAADVLDINNENQLILLITVRKKFLTLPARPPWMNWPEYSA